MPTILNVSVVGCKAEDSVDKNYSVARLTTSFGFRVLHSETSIMLLREP